MVKPPGLRAAAKDQVSFFETVSSAFICVPFSFLEEFGMPDILHFASNDELPAHYSQQIRDFMRIVWADTCGDNLTSPVCPVEWHPHFCILAEGTALISSAAAVWKILDHAGQTYKVYGLSGVMTYPAHRKMGYGHRIVQEASDYIRAAGDGDLAILWTGPGLNDFYAQNGWEHPDGMVVRVGDPADPQPVNGHLMMMFLSDHARAHRPDFAAAPLYFGPH
jgi:GNAT superfamily N-acetyltransferase